MKIDHDQARKVLEEETQLARTLAPAGKWVERVKALSRECETKNKTMIAMLGTAMLAKATDPNVDVFALQVGGKKDSNTYSARALCKDVLAAEANRLGIDLGVTGREPLNNQPFFGKPRVSRGMKVRSDARKALGTLVDILEAIDKTKTEKEARAALRAFLQVRKKQLTAIEVEEGEGDNLEESDLLGLVERFIKESSESGRRAQAVAAGLLDVLVGENRVLVSRVNDPSRRYPGDVAVLEQPPSRSIERVFEVRDKPVTEEDLHNIVERARSAQVMKIGVLAVSSQQDVFDAHSAIQWAEARQTRLAVYFGWTEFLRETLFWSCLPRLSVGPAYRMIAKRLASLEVSKEGLDFWKSIL